MENTRLSFVHEQEFRKLLSLYPLGVSRRGHGVDIRTLQRPLKQRYREEPDAARITLRVVAQQFDSPLRCRIETTGGTVISEAHPGVGGPGTASCSGDLLLAA